MEDMAFAPALRQVQYENTYITGPEGYGPNTKFERHKVYEVLVQMLKQHLEGQQYDPVKSSQISKMLADDLRETVWYQPSVVSMLWVSSGDTIRDRFTG
jgi:hypothetical protein